MTLKRMDNVLIIVDDLEAVKSFFIELGLTLEGETTVEGPLIANSSGSKTSAPPWRCCARPTVKASNWTSSTRPKPSGMGLRKPVNTLGLRRIIFNVSDIGEVVARMQAFGAEIIGQMQYENSYRLAYIRGPEGIIVALAEQLGQP